MLNSAEINAFSPIYVESLNPFPRAGFALLGFPGKVHIAGAL